MGQWKTHCPSQRTNPTTCRHPSIPAFPSPSLLFPSPTVCLQPTGMTYRPLSLVFCPPLLSSMCPYLYWPLDNPELVTFLPSPVGSPLFSDSANGKDLSASKQSHVCTCQVLCLLPASWWVLVWLTLPPFGNPVL